jgi:hypothetical protein
LDNEERVLWVDAVCINQNDFQERNHQVMQMGQIYSKAERVVVWLGESNEDSKIAIDFLVKTGAGTRWTLLPHASVLEEDATIQGNKQLSAVESLCARQYWRRLWIIQR